MPLENTGRLQLINLAEMQCGMEKGMILFSTKNAASLNIMRHLEKEWNWKKKGEEEYFFSACGKEGGCTAFKAIGYEKEILEIEPEEKAGYYLYASTHKSEKKMPALTAHIPGNWSDAKMGGEEKTLNVAYACKLKQILKFLKEGAERQKLDWQVNMEVDHHGPTPQGGKLPLIFVEIGSGEEEWANETAGSVVAEAMMKALARPAPKCKTYIGIGGGHYAPKFGKIMLENEEMAVGHIIPEYKVNEVDEKMILQAIEKSVEKVEGALFDWKGLKKEGRGKMTAMLENIGVKWERA